MIVAAFALTALAVALLVPTCWLLVVRCTLTAPDQPGSDDRSWTATNSSSTTGNTSK